MHSSEATPERNPQSMHAHVSYAFGALRCAFAATNLANCGATLPQERADSSIKPKKPLSIVARHPYTVLNVFQLLGKTEVDKSTSFHSQKKIEKDCHLSQGRDQSNESLLGTPDHTFSRPHMRCSYYFTDYSPPIMAAELICEAWPP